MPLSRPALKKINPLQGDKRSLNREVATQLKDWIVLGLSLSGLLPGTYCWVGTRGSVVGEGVGGMGLGGHVKGDESVEGRIRSSGLSGTQ